jgi:hypothetical protein
MKKFIFFLLFTPLTALAQQGMSQQEMEQMMAEVQKMQACLQTVDQSALKKLEEEQKTFEKEIKAMCASGDRDQAQAKAISYTKDIMNSPEIVKMRKCTENLTGMAKQMVPDMSFEALQKEFDKRHVCDEMGS